MKLSDYQPTWRWVLVEPILPEMTSGGLYLPEKDIQEVTTPTAKVVKVGPDVERIQVGDIVAIETVGYAKLMDFEDAKGIYSLQEMVIMGYTRTHEDDSIRITPSNRAKATGARKL